MRGQHNQISPHRVGLALLVLYMFISGTQCSPPIPSFAFTCPQGWTLGYGKCYKFFSAPLTYDDAQDVCSNFGNGHLAIAKDSHVKASFVRYVVQNSYPTSDIWWQGASLPAGRDPTLSVDLANGEVLDFRVGFLDDLEIQPGPRPYRRCLAMNANPNSYLYPVVYGSTFRPCKEKLPFVCVQECCPAGHPNYPSTGGMLKCVNGRCVPRFRECDGVNDCGDNTDERDCNTVSGVNSFLYTGTTSGTFILPGYGSYDYYQWSIEVNPGYQIFANISNLSIEKDTDILEVWCGGRSREKSALLWRHSGVQLFVGPLKCLSAFMTFVFYSDYDTQLSGFQVSWAATSLPARQILSANTLSEGALILNPLPRGSRREWKIATDNKWLIVTLIRKRLKLPPGSSLSVFDGDSYDDPLLFTYRAGDENTEDWLSAQYIQSTGQYMSLCLWTPIDGGAYGELEFIYYAGCHVELAATHAIIQNAGRYDTVPYPNFLHCTYYVTTNSSLLDGVPGENEYLEIIIREVDIDPQDRLVIITDGVAVYDTDNVLGTFPIIIPPQAQTVTIEFWTSGLRNDKGFVVGLSTGCPDLSFTTETIQSPSSPTFAQNSQITISCPPGYYLAQEHFSPNPANPNTGPVTITCLVNGWNVPQKPNCYKLVCPDLPTVENAFIPQQTSPPVGGYEYLDTVSYVCYPGFSFIPSNLNSVTCESDGGTGVRWSTTPSCGGASNCPNLPSTLDFGTVVLSFGSTPTELYATLEYTANDGYVLDGGVNDPDHTKYRVCVSGAWFPASTPPISRRLTCRLPLIRNAMPWTAPLDINTMAARSVACRPGFERNGPSDITCQNDQTFTTLPTCTDIAECLTNPCGANANCIETPGSFECWCDPGFVLATNGLSCIDKVDCSGGVGPCDSLNGVCTDTPAGSYTCSCTAISGTQLFEFDGFNGFFNPPGDDPNAVNAKYRIDHTCVSVQCAYNHNNPNAGTILLRYKSAYHEGDQISFLCEAGLVPSRTPAVSTCDISGNWVPALITCIDATCTVGSTFNSATQPIYSVTSTSAALAVGATVIAGTTVTLTCNVVAGRPSQYTVERTCTWDSVAKAYSFEGDDPYACEFTRCLDHTFALSIGNGDLVFNGGPAPLLAGSEYILNCNSGSFLFGSTGNAQDNLVICGADGLWDIGDAICAAEQCANPLSVRGAVQNDNGYAVGTAVTYTCTQLGFVLRATPSNCVSFTCNAANVWTPDPAGCTLACVDDEAPVITFCPTSYAVPRNSIVNLPVPTATDNNGPVVFTTSFAAPNQNWIDGSPLITPPLVVTYTARGQDPTSPTDTCTFTVSEEDQTIPRIMCPSSFTYYAGSTALVNILTLIPSHVFTTESGTTVMLSPPNFTPSMGFPNVQSVTATVTDTAGLINTCTFAIDIRDSCTWLDLPNPANGQTTCQTIGAQPRTCTVECNRPNYEFRIGNTNVLQHIFTCNAASGVWVSPLQGSLPDGVTPSCAPTQQGQAEQIFNFEWNIGSAEPNPQGCETTYVDYFVLQAPAASLAFGCAGVVTTIQTPVTSSSVIPGANPVLSIQFKVSMETPSGGVPTATELEDCKDLIDFTIKNVQNPYQDISRLPANSATCQFAFLNFATSMSSGNANTACAVGTIDVGTLCLPCPPGSRYVDVATGCTPCLRNMFSDNSGATSCTACPSNQGTEDIGSTSTQCQGTCSTFGAVVNAGTGLQPCSQCPIDEHVSVSDPDTQCQACPTGTGTLGPGAQTAADCLDLCPAGSYSPSGLDETLRPCILCPVGTYQPASRQIFCIPCPNHLTSTSVTGSTSSASCQTEITVPSICATTNCNAVGTCVVRNNRPVCNCNAGYTGPSCATQINFCISSPCNGGVCNPVLNGYTCTNCLSGFSGSDCEINNNCDAGNDPCTVDQGQCQTTDTGAICICAQNFGGSFCDQAAVPCTDRPCINGVCDAPNGGSIRRQCACEPGYTGVDCDEQILECNSNPCRHGGNCIDGTDGFTCQCTSPWNGDRCQSHVDICPNPSTQCNGGQCIVDYMNGPSKCRCDGQNNWFPTDPGNGPIIGEPDIATQCVFQGSCAQAGNTCINNGQCVDLPASTPGFRCNFCDSGWEGNRCQTSIDECASNPCANGGTCVDMHLGYMCQCTPGFDGDNCNNDINECIAMACDAEGTQTAVNGRTYCQCVCKPGYTGSRCETNWDDCGLDTCLYGEMCTDQPNGFSCQCSGDRFGNTCQNLPVPCTTNPCLNSGQCRPLGLCSCVGGAYGSTCDSTTDICMDVPGYCQNGGTCTTLGEVMGRCNCPPGFTGDRCDLIANACDNNVCRNGGTCISSLDDFRCQCRTGYSGLVCDIGPSNCQADTCANSGTCVESPYGSFCCCTAGRGGARCEKLINRDYDLHCDGSDDSESIAFQMNPFKLFSDSFSIAAWVRYRPDTLDDGVNDATGVFLSFYTTDASGQDYNNPMDPFENKRIVLTLDDTRATVYLPGVGSPQTYYYTQANGEMYEIDDGQWYRVVVTCNGTTGQLTVYVNTVRVAQDILLKTDYFEYAWLTVGNGYNNIAGTYMDSFAGSVSQVQVWDWDLSAWDVVEATAVPVSPNPPALIPEGLVMDYTRWVFYPGCWLESPTDAGNPYTPLPPEQPPPRFTNCPTEPITAIGTERRTKVVWDELEAINTITSIWCRYKSGDGFTWGFYTNVCIIKNAQGFTETCKFDIIIRKLNCPDPLIYDGELPPNCVWLDVFGGVRICEPECPTGLPHVSLVSVAQPLSYMCDKLGSFNPRYPYNEGRIPACGAETEYEVLYNIVIEASYPNVSLCAAVMEVGGISEELRVRIREIDADSHYFDPDGVMTDNPLCEEDDCSDVVMHVDCPGTHITMELYYTPVDITYNTGTTTILYDNARDLLQEILIDNNLFDSALVHDGMADPASICFTLFPVCRSGAGYLKGRCVVCAKGQYAPRKDEPCRMCPAGSYQDNPGSVSCKPCPGGKTTEYWGAVSEAECIWTCNPGEYYNIDFRKCKPCPIGTYSDVYGMTRCCKPCQPYQTTLYVGADSEDACVDTCPDGEMLLYDDHCVPCERGYYRKRDLQDDCEPCPYGFTTLYPGSVYLTDCSSPDCSPGSYINNTECIPCPLGYYQPANSQLECIKCPLHQTTLNVGSTKEAHCIYACPPGAELIDGYKCKPCEIGFWKDNGLPDEFCKPCPDGFITQTTGATSIAKCIVPACEPGEFLDDNICKPCPIDTYQPNYWQTFCQDCPPGTSTGFATGSDSENDCKRYCPAGQEDQGGICLPCPQGTWKGSPGHAACTNCTDGLYTAGTGSTSQTQCDREHCYPGEFLNTDLECEECERGYYQPEFQQGWCLPCLNGLTTIGTGNIESSDCILDCYSGQGWDSEVEHCVLCPQGTYRTQGEDDLCTACRAGYTTPAGGSYTAADCTQVACYSGYYLLVDVNACKECPIGTYQPDKYQHSCKHCPQGTTTVNPASRNHTDCKRDCPAGYETDDYYNCQPCRRGYYRSGHDGFDCARCPPGATTLTAGATSEEQCTLGDCLAGHYQDGQVCRPCPYGTYQPNKWQPSCIPCGKYYTTATTGSTSPLNCTVKASCNRTCISYSLGGTCEATDYGHVCTCRPGWTGHHPNCIPLCSTKYCSNYEDCHTDEQDQPYCRCRPGWDGKCKDESPTDLAILIGAPVAGGVLFILLLCIGMFACGCCSCRPMGRHYHRYRSKGSPASSIHSSSCAIAPLEQTLFQQPCVRYAAQQMHQPYNPTSSMIGNEPTVIRIQTNSTGMQPAAQPAAPQQAPGITIDYGYNNPKLNSHFKFFQDAPANKLSNNIRDPTVATMNFD